MPPAVAPPPAPHVSTAVRPETAPGYGMHRFYGVVYDMTTLKAVRGAQVHFTIPGQTSLWVAHTDDHGRYQVDVVQHPQLHAFIKQAGYRAGALEDSDPPFRLRSAKSRRMTAEETSDYDLEAFPIKPRPGEPLIHLDLVLLPERMP